MRRFASFLSLALFLLFASPVAAQTYVRPSKGAPITLVSDDTTPTYTSPLYDWSAFEAAVVSLYVTEPGGEAAIADCTVLPLVQVLQYPAKNGVAHSRGQNNDPFNLYRSGGFIVGSVAYEVHIAAAYAAFQITTENNPTGTDVCSFTVRVTPLAFRSDQTPIGTTRLAATVVDTGTYVGPGTGHPGVDFGQTMYLENVGTALAYCGFRSDVSTTSYEFTLAAAAVAHDGSGGKISMPFGANYLLCITGAGLSTTIKGFIR